MKLEICIAFFFISIKFVNAGTTNPINDILNALDKVYNSGELLHCSTSQTATYRPSVLPPSTSSECSTRDRFFRGINTNAMTVQSAIQWLSDQNAQLIILGENHHSSSYDFNSELIRELILKNRKIDCLFIEEQSKHKNSSEKMSKDSTTLDYYHGWKESAKVAQSMGVKVYFVDEQNLPRRNGKLLYYMDSPKAMEYRNQIMSQRISDLISTGEYHAGIALNGKEHLFDDFQKNQYHSLQSMTRAKGVSTKTVNLQDYFRPNLEKPIRASDGTFHRSTNDDFSWNWKGCDPNPYTGKEKVAFKNNWGGAIVRKLGYWSDFDLTILLP